jgi:hypothetical protein
MAIVQGIREKVHLPIYDSVRLRAEEQLHEVEKSGTLKFFVNVQGKTKLETNLQSASLLPHYNTFEARAMRVVISDLPPEFPDDFGENTKTVSGDDLEVTTEDNERVDAAGTLEGTEASAGPPPVLAFDENTVVTANVTLTVARAVELLREAAKAEDGYAELAVDDEDAVELVAADDSEVDVELIANTGVSVWLSEEDIFGMFDDPRELKLKPLPEQVHGGNGSGTLIGKLIYNTVTTLYVGEKVMIQMPTWFFPGGAGPFSEQDHVTTHGTPSPLDTFRFAEPIYIDKQQNFRVEIEIPESDMVKELQRIYGPLYVWVVLDGYMERGVQ